MKYRKKPVVVDAIHYRGKQDDSLLKSFVDGRYLYRDGKTYKWLIITPEGDHQVSDGDYIIKGVKGEFYPCKPDIFEMTYESAENDCFQNGKDHIVLTVEEAKGLLEISRDYRMYLFEHCRIPLSLSVNEAFTALRERIEQAENK